MFIRGNIRGKDMKGEKGFTLIELLVVIGIIIALAAVIIPLVIQFATRGESGARAAEFASVQTGIDAMMASEIIIKVEDGVDLQPIFINNEGGHSEPLTTFTSDDITLEDYLRDSHTNWCYTWDDTGLITEQSDNPIDDTDHSPECT